MADIRQLLARRQDPYRWVDISAARRMAGFFCLFSAAFGALLWPLSPPTAEIGASGWALGGVLLASGPIAAYLIRIRPQIWGFRLMLVGAYYGLAGISVMQWLAGGLGAPYNTLLLIPSLFVCAIYTSRICVVFVLAVGLSLAAPLVYDGASGNAAASALAFFTISAGLSLAQFRLYMGVRAQRAAAAQNEQEAREEARVDELTGIGNRRAFEEALVDEIARAKRMSTKLAMAMGDLKDFKSVNDEYGHLEGDNCLQRVAETLDSALRSPDRVFRWGGDEFALLLPGTDQSGAEALAERLAAKVSGTRRPDGDPLVVDFAAAELRMGMDAKDLTEAADLALLTARARPEHERAHH